MSEEGTLDRLAGGWWIHQLRRGHRFNTDDVCTAWVALGAAPAARRVLDLGSGVGSIGLMALLGLADEARLVGVEVQAVSVALARRTLQHNGIEARVRLIQADLRAPDLLADEEPFDLILANPPYLPPARSVASPNPQRAAARLELHGDVFDYCRVAAAALAPEGRLVLCHAAADPRPVEAIAAAGLSLQRRLPVVFRAGAPPMIAIHTAGRGGEAAPEPAPLTIRDSAGQWTAAWHAVRRAVRIEA